MNIRFFAVFFMFFGVGATSAMESGAQRTVALVSSDEKSFRVDRSIAEKFGVVKGMLEDFEGSGAAISAVPLPKIKANTLKTILGILEQVKDLPPRKIDGQLSPYMVQPVVDDFLKDSSFIEIKNIVLAADYAEIPFLINAAARVLVYKSPTHVEQIVQGENFIVIPAVLHAYLQKHLGLLAAGITEEYSIDDFVVNHGLRLGKIDIRVDLMLTATW